MRVVLLSTYELGRQPFGLASPAAWLRGDGFEVSCSDLSADSFPVDAIRAASLICFHIPMHTATRMAVDLIPRIRDLNHRAHLCFFGLYASLNEDYLRELGAGTVLGGEFEAGLLRLCRELKTGSRAFQAAETVSLERQTFAVPDRSDLPELSEYARLRLPDGRRELVGYVEATRGCRRECRHCPVVPVYEGNIRVIQEEVVLADIRQQVEKGARHITFGDPDFLNGPGHSSRIVKRLHAEFRDVTYDVTIKVEHLLKRPDFISLLSETGCSIVTSAVESFDNQVLEKLAKGHKAEDVPVATRMIREAGMTFRPTFLPFTPWTTLEGYGRFLKTLVELDLAASVEPIQLAIRLLIPAGSKMLELAEIRELVEDFNPRQLAFPWKHKDPEVDLLQKTIFETVGSRSGEETNKAETFREIWRLALPGEGSDLFPLSRVEVPYLNEPWYC